MIYLNRTPEDYVATLSMYAHLESIGGCPGLSFNSNLFWSWGNDQQIRIELRLIEERDSCDKIRKARFESPWHIMEIQEDDWTVPFTSKIVLRNARLIVENNPPTYTLQCTRVEWYINESLIWSLDNPPDIQGNEYEPRKNVIRYTNFPQLFVSEVDCRILSGFRHRLLERIVCSWSHNGIYEDVAFDNMIPPPPGFIPPGCPACECTYPVASASGTMSNNMIIDCEIVSDFVIEDLGTFTCHCDPPGVPWIFHVYQYSHDIRNQYGELSAFPKNAFNEQWGEILLGTARIRRSACSCRRLTGAEETIISTLVQEPYTYMGQLRNVNRAVLKFPCIYTIQYGACPLEGGIPPPEGCGAGERKECYYRAEVKLQHQEAEQEPKIAFIDQFLPSHVHYMVTTDDIQFINPINRSGKLPHTYRKLSDVAGFFDNIIGAQIHDNNALVLLDVKYGHKYMDKIINDINDVRIATDPHRSVVYVAYTLRDGTLYFNYTELFTGILHYTNPIKIDTNVIHHDLSVDNRGFIVITYTKENTLYVKHSPNLGETWI